MTTATRPAYAPPSQARQPRVRARTRRTSRSDVHEKRRFGQHPQSEDDSRDDRPRPIPAVIGGQQRGEEHGDHGRKRDVELKAQRVVHDGWRGAEQCGRDHAAGTASEPPPDDVRCCHADPQECEDHDLPERHVGRPHREEETGRARDERRVEGRAREHRAKVAAGEVAPALHGVLEVVGVVPLRRVAVDGQPDRSDDEDNDERAGDGRPFSPALRGAVIHGAPPEATKPRRAARALARRGAPGRTAAPGTR